MKMKIENVHPIVRLLFREHPLDVYHVLHWPEGRKPLGLLEVLSTADVMHEPVSQAHNPGYPVRHPPEAGQEANDLRGVQGAAGDVKRKRRGKSDAALGLPSR